MEVYLLPRMRTVLFFMGVWLLAGVGAARAQSAIRCGACCAPIRPASGRFCASRPHFSSYAYWLRPREYFYPASTVKLPTAALALQKIGALNRSTLADAAQPLTCETPLRIDSAFAGQTRVVADSSARGYRPTLGNYLRKVLLVSDNDAFNRLYEFVGQQALNEQLRAKGLCHTRIIHRLSVGDREPSSRYTNPIKFFADSARTPALYQQSAAYNAPVLPPLRAGRYHIGTGYMEQGHLVGQPMRFDDKNFFPLREQQQVLRVILFPEVVPRRQRFALSADDYQFLRR